MKSKEAPLRPEVRAVLDLSLLGNSLALDFVNTVDWRLDPQRAEDLLTDEEVLLHWGGRMGLLSPADVQDATPDGRASPLLPRALDLREALYSIFSALAGEMEPATSDLDVLREAFAEGVARARLGLGEDGTFRWSWAETNPAERVRWAVAASAVELLSSGDLARIKQCRDEGCGWVFVDLSKNISRRWCSMQGCGARAKMRRQYRRKTAQSR
jgi:predicted RNA-binding Zn ribbon-like protein